MIPEHILNSLVIQTESKLLMVVIDGLGGLPVRGKTELEAAKIPNLDRLAAKSIWGLVDPISYGITPGSGPSRFQNRFGMTRFLLSCFYVEKQVPISMAWY